jgi:hypothetical protein
MARIYRTAGPDRGAELCTATVERVYDAGMGTQEKEARRARAAYVGAVAQLARAMTDFERVGVPLEPLPSGRIAPWSPQQQEVMQACAEAWQAVVSQRRSYEVATREAGHPETWPHA